MKLGILSAACLLPAACAMAQSAAYIAFPDTSPGRSVVTSVGADGFALESVSVNSAGVEHGACHAKHGAGFEKSDLMSCYGYYILEQPDAKAKPAEAVGIPGFTGGPVTELYKGFKLSGVEGVDYCGERDNCDEIYVVRFASEAAITEWLGVLDKGCKAKVTGTWMWNFESQDLVVAETRCQ